MERGTGRDRLPSWAPGERLSDRGRLTPVARRLRGFVSRWLVSPLQGTTFRRWLALLAAERPRIDPEYVPRTAITLASSLVSSVQARLEERQYGDRLETVEVREPVFILGHYRSGTTHLQNLLAVDPRLTFPNYYQVSFPSTFLLTEPTGAALGRLLAPRKRPYDDVAIALEAPAEDEVALCAETFLSPHMCWHFPDRSERYRGYLTIHDAAPSERVRWKRSLRRLAAKLSLKGEGRPVVFKSPCHTARLPVLLDLFPDARFVHIHRHPYEVFRSTRHMERHVGPLFQFQRRSLDGLDEFILWRYRRMYETFLESRPLVPQGRLTEVAYERLVSDPVGTLRRIYADLGLPEFDSVRPAVESYLHAVRRHRSNDHEDLDAVTRRRVAREWQPFFDEWRYPSHGGKRAAGGRGR